MAEIKEANGFIDWLDQRLAVKTLTKVLMTEYWIPKNINWLWAMGVVLTVLFSLLLVSGIFLLMYYKPDTALAFDSVNRTIMQEVAMATFTRSECFASISNHLYSYACGDLLWLI